jgi:hypothetical protein
MAKERYETGKAPSVTVAECAGDVVVRSWSEIAVTVKGQHQVEAMGEQMTIRSTGSIAVTVPAQSQVALDAVSGDAVVKGVEGGLQVGQIMGDLGLKNLSSANLTTVYGDLSLRNVDGEVTVESVMGDLAARNLGGLSALAVHGDLAASYVSQSVRVDEAMGDVNLNTVNGDVKLQNVHRDVNLANLGGKLQVAHADGDIRLSGGLSPGKHNCTATGDIVLRWPQGAPLALLVTGGDVTDKIGLQDVTESEEGYSGRLGQGETTLVLEAGGRVIIKEAEDADWSDKFGAEFSGMGAEFADIGVELAGLGEQLSNEFSAHMQELGARMEERFGSDFAQTMAEKAAKRTERAVKRAMREAERMRVRAGAWTPPPAPTSPRTKKAEQVSAEEQKKILEMLEKGVISVDEAETLLKALES